MARLKHTIADPDGVMALRVHGGRLDIADRLYPQAPSPWIDLSTGINPVGYPIPTVSPAAYSRLPLSSDLDALLAAASNFYGVPAGAAILAVPGTELAIRLLPVVIGRSAGKAARQVGIIGPTYGSHAAAWRAAGASVHDLGALPDPHRSDLDMVVVVNPNNPDGRIFTTAELAAFAKAWTRAGRRLVVDEAFAEIRPDISLLREPMLPPGVVVLRSLGKFFGLAGLRLGFVVSAAADADGWCDLLGDWPVSGPACEMATTALQDAEWIAAARRRLGADRRRLDQTLACAGLAPRGGTDLFGLYQRRDDIDLVDHFARRGILIRGFAARPSYYRFGLPANEPEWHRLRAACAAAAV